MQKEDPNYHAKTVEQTIKELKSNPTGLTEKEANTRKIKYGPNVIPEKKPLSPIIVFLRQFRGLMIYILLAAAVISFFLARTVDVYIILGVILINATIGFFQEYRAEKAIKALKKMIVQKAKLYREGELIQIPAKELVPGDIIILEEGDRVPADARLIELKNFQTVEASLTGESFPTNKTLKVLPEKTALADKSNTVWLI